VSELYRRVVDATYSQVKKLVGRPGVFLLVPPGSSRGCMLERLLREGVVDGAYAYPRLAEELRARGLAVGDLPGAEELERVVDRRVVAVESSLQAVELKEGLGERVELIYLPKYFKEAAKDVDKELLQVAEVEHRGLGEGISPKLLRPGDKELKKGRDALLALSPGAVGLKDAAKETLGRFPFKAVSALPMELLGPALLVSAVLQAVGLGAASLAVLVGTAVGVGRRQLEDLAARLLELFARGREPRDKVAAGFAKLVRRALEAEPYINDDRYEAVVDQVALEWGMDVETFKALVRSLAALARGELVTKEELSRELAQHVKRGELEKIEEAIRQLVESKLAEIEKRLEEVRRRLDSVEKDLKRRGLPIRVLSVEEVEAGQLYDNFRVKGGTPAVSVAEGVFRLVETGRFKEAVQEVLRRLDAYGVVVLRGPKGVGKSTLAAYAAWLALRGGVASYAARIQKMEKGQRMLLRNVLDAVEEGRLVAVFDPSPLEFYIEPGAYAETTQAAASAASATLEELLKFAEENRGRGLVLAVIPDDLYDALDGEVKKRAERYVLPLDLRDAEFLTEVIYEYSGCRETPREKLKILAEKIAQLDGGYTLVAKYAGLWLRERGCNAGDVERAVEEAKSQPKLFLAHYIRDVLLWRSSEEERVRLMYRVAVPLLLHAYFGPVPEGVTYITQAKDGVVFYQPEEIEKLTQPRWDLLKAGLQPIAKWLAQEHEDLVEEVLKDLAGLNGEEAREPYKEALSDLIKTLDWARNEILEKGLAELGIPKDEALKVFNIIHANFGIPEKDRELTVSLLTFVDRRLTAVFKNSENRRCWRRVALIVGLALAGSPVLPLGVQLPKDAAETMGDALKPCAVDDYLMIGNKIPTLLLNVVWFPYYVEAQYARDLSQIRRIRERLGVLTPYADTEVIRAVKKITDEPVSRWRRRLFTHFESFYALGLAALASGSEVDGETADMLIYIASVVTRWVFHPAAVLPILAALRPMGEKAPHRYVATLAAASQLKTLNPETVRYIYDALQQFKDRLLESGRIWPLVEAIDAHSNLLRKHLIHIEDRWEEAVANMCSLYYEVKKRYTTGLNSGFSAQRLLDAVARAYVMAVALNSDNLAQLMQRHCGLSDIVKEAEAVRSVLDEAATHPEELRKIMENDADFKEWVTTRSPIGDAGRMAKMLTSWFMHELASYKLVRAINERGELDEKKLKEAAEDFEKVAEIDEKLEQWSDYLASRSLALRIRVFAVKSWEEFHKTAEGFQKLWEETEEHLDPIAEYLVTAVGSLGEYLVYQAAFGDKERAEKLLKEWRWLLDYVPEASVITRLMLRLFSVGEGAKLDEIVYAFWPRLLQVYYPALWLLAGILQKDKALEICKQLSGSEVCVVAVDAAAGSQEATKRFKSFIVKVRPNIKKVMWKAHRLLDRVDGRSLVEVLAPGDSRTRLALMLLAAVEGRVDAVRLHGLLGSVDYRNNVNKPLFRAVYENCGDLNREECRMALLKLYYYHI